jgi:hypothetical protein
MALKLRDIYKAAHDDVNRIVSPQLRKYLLHNNPQNEAFDDWVLDRIIGELRESDRDRRSSFSASQSGGCLRAQEFKFLGSPGLDDIDPQLKQIFLDGHWRHLRLQATFLQAGIVTDIEIPIQWPRRRAMGTADGEGVVPSDHPRTDWRGKTFGLEIKGANPWVFGGVVKRDKAIESHLYQTHRYMLIRGWDLMSIFYEDKGSQNWHEIVFEPDPEWIAWSHQELKDLNAAIDNRKLDPMLPSCKIRKGDAWNNCAYAGESGVCVRAGTWPDPEDITINVDEV